MNIKNRKFKIMRLKKGLRNITKHVDSLIEQQRNIKSKLDTQISKLKIEENGITLADIQFSAANSKHWVGHFDQLESYVNLTDERKYCEFNGNIFLVTDVYKHIMKSYGRYEDLK